MGREGSKIVQIYVTSFMDDPFRQKKSFTIDKRNQQLNFDFWDVNKPFQKVVDSNPTLSKISNLL